MFSILAQCMISTLLILSTSQSYALKTFKFVNQGFISDFQRGEYDSMYRALHSIPQPNTLGLYFYNNTPNAFTFAIGMGFDYNLRWVWAANRARPVSEGATLTFGNDGNLVLADVDHQVVWQTNTSNKGVVGIKLLETGNLVLYDAKRKFIWQSFDHPTDTLLPGQSLRAGVADKLVSRVNTTSSLEGPYSVLMRPIRLSMYYKSKNSRHLLQYHNIFFALPIKVATYEDVLVSIPKTIRPRLYFPVENGAAVHYFTEDEYYNSTSSFLRLDYDGNLRVYAFFDETDLYPWAMGMVGRWEVKFTLFIPSGTDPMHASECYLPERCGAFGLCYKDQCIACPSPSNELLPWTDKCEPPKLGACSGGKNVEYYKMEGVEYFTSRYTKGEGPMTETECQNKCSFDCKCLGYFYHQESSKCWIAFDLKTIRKSGNRKHFGYIKTAN